MSWTRRCAERVGALLVALALASGCSSPAGKQNPEDAPSADHSATQGISSTEASYSGNTFPMTITDFTGNTLTLEEKPERIAILSGTPLNIFYDAGGSAVAMANLSENVRLAAEHADAIRALPQLGMPYNIDAEALVALDPDLVITLAGAQDTLASQLREMGITTFTSTIKSLDDLTMAYEIFGALAGTTAQAEQRIQEITAHTREVIDGWPADEEISAVMLFVTAQSLSVKLDNSIAGEILSMLGVTNIASDMTPENPGAETTTLDVEAIVAAQPDYVLVTSMIANNDEARAKLEEHFASSSAWQAVDAVREGKVVYLPQQYFLYNAGPYYADSVAYLAASLRPDIFGTPVDPA